MENGVLKHLTNQEIKSLKLSKIAKKALRNKHGQFTSLYKETLKILGKSTFDVTDTSFNGCLTSIESRLDVHAKQIRDVQNEIGAITKTVVKMKVLNHLNHLY